MLFGQFNQFGRPPAEGTPVPMPTAAQQFQPLPAQPPVNFPMGQYGHNPMYGYGFPQQHPSAYGYMSQPFGFGRPMRPPGFHAVTKPAVECSPLTTEELLSLFEDTIMQALEGSNDLVQPAMAAEIMQALPVDPNFILTNEKAISTRHLLEAQLKEFVQGGGSIPQMPEKFADVSKLWEAVRTTFASELDHLRVEQGNAENHGVKQLLSMVCRTLHAAISISPFGGGKAARKRTQLPEVKAVAKRKVEGGTVEIPRSTTAEKTLQDAVVPNEEPKAAKKKRAPKAKAKMSPRKSTSPDDSDVPRVRTRSRGSPGEEGQKAAGRKPLTTQEAAHYGALQPLIVPNCLPRSWAAAGVDECSLSTLCEVFDFLALARPLLYDSKLTVASALQSLETDIFESGGFIVPEGAYLSSELECMVMTKHGEHVVVDVADAKASSCGLMTFRQFVEILLGLGPGENRFDTSGIHKIHCSLMRLLILDRQGNSRKPKDESPTSAKDSARRKKSTKEEKLEVKSEADDLEESEKEDGPVDNNAYQLVFQRLPLTPMTWTHYVCEHLMAVCEELQELINSPHKLRRGPMTWEALEVADNISEYRQLAAEVAVDEYERIPFHRRVAILQFLVRQVCKTQLFRSYVEGGIERTWQVEKNLQGERRKAAKSLPRKLKLAQKTMCEAFDSLSPEEKKSVLPAEMHAYKKHQTCQVVLEAKLDDVKHASVVEKRAVYQETAEEKRAYELKVTHSERLLRNLILFACPRKLPAGYDRHGNLYWIVRSVNLTLQVDKAFVGPLRLAWRNNGNVECQFAPDYPSESWSAPPDVQTRLQALKLHPSFPFFTEFLRELPAGTSGSAFLESYLRASLSPVDLYVPDETPATLPLVPVLDSPKEEVAVDVSPAIEAEAPAAWEGYDDDHLLTFDVDRPSLLPAPPAKCLSLHSLLEPARLPGEWGRTFLSHSAARMYPTSPMVPVPPVWEALRALLACE
ncbi:MAG: hypothetical protein KVP17_001638 [Porospora cf. gigantea B]|uniref:uncharacterized protein n=1 Tax=Porospora cf. gigantea B TaxID=2853592 RepID=UPI003571B9A0|nr:MAG: hypothetical protein KVP17_001638 [Porospora cf. gigantea B]